MKKLLIAKGLKYLAWLVIPICIKINKQYVKKVYGNTKGYDFSTALSFDKWGNREFRTGLNYLMLTPNSQHHFGCIDETMSSVFGKNERDGTLTEEGLKWAKRLNKVDTDHCKNSINLNINYQDKDFNLIQRKKK